MKRLDLENPADARTFITEAVNDVLKEVVGSKATVLHLADGTTRDINNLTDSEAVQYAYELLPIYKARHPDLVDEQHIQ